MRSLPLRSTFGALIVSTVLLSCVRVGDGDEERSDAQRVVREQSAPHVAEAPVPAIELGEPVAKVPSEVTLLSAGDEPRAVLRLKPSPGAREELSLRMAMVVAMQIGSHDVPARSIPSIEAKLAAVVVDEGKGGDELVRYRFETIEAKAGEATTEVSARVQDAVQRAVDDMQGTKGTIAVTDRGKLAELVLDTRPGADAGIQPAIEGFRQSFNQLFAWLPEDAVGPGATWRAVTHFEQNHIEIQQTAEYRLVSRDGDRVELSFDLEQQAVEGSEARTALPGGALEVEMHSVKGSGRVVLDLAKVMPIEGTAKSAGATRSRVSFGGAPEPLLMQLEFDLALRSS